MAYRGMNQRVTADIVQLEEMEEDEGVDSMQPLPLLKRNLLSQYPRIIYKIAVFIS